MKNCIMKNVFFLIFVLMSSFFIGCTNPTHIHQASTLLPEASLEATIDTSISFLSTVDKPIVFEMKLNSQVSLFSAEEFCYDEAQNSMWFRSNESTEYFAIPKDSITICLKGNVKDNSYVSRNKILRYTKNGAIYPAALIWLVGASIAAAMEEEDGDDSSEEFFLVTSILALGAIPVGASIGALSGVLSWLFSGDANVTSEIEDKCEDNPYSISPEEEINMLKTNYLCPIEKYN